MVPNMRHQKLQQKKSKHKITKVPSQLIQSAKIKGKNVPSNTDTK